jgi:hypothetical protein
MATLCWFFCPGHDDDDDGPTPAPPCASFRAGELVLLVLLMSLLPGLDAKVGLRASTVANIPADSMSSLASRITRFERLGGVKNSGCGSGCTFVECMRNYEGIVSTIFVNGLDEENGIGQARNKTYVGTTHCPHIVCIAIASNSQRPKSIYHWVNHGSLSSSTHIGALTSLCRRRHGICSHSGWPRTRIYMAHGGIGIDRIRRG